MSDKVVQVGDVVHFVLDTGPHVGECRPAMVVRVWSNTCTNLLVFTDAGNDDPYAAFGDNPVRWVTSALFDESGHPAQRSWHHLEVTT
jgi:hypothetical protein